MPDSALRFMSRSVSMPKTCSMLIAAATLATGCSQVLGFKEPSLEKPSPDDANPGDTGLAIDAPIDMGPAACMPSACPFGCDSTTNACREGKLWIFRTAGATAGNEFGGTDIPPNVRAGADGRCLATYSSRYMMRECNPSTVHATLSVSSADSIPLMATKYGIPTNVEVHRADDDVLVSDHWNDLTDPTKQLRVPATTAPTTASGTVWTGTNPSSTCRNWTSGATADTGSFGFTTRTEVNWLSEGSFACDNVAALLCICWSTGP